MHFNIGDEVVVTGPTRCGSNAHIGKRFKITECDDIYFSTLDLPWFPWRSLELVPLTVGDWVKTISGTIFRIGDIYPFVDGSASVWVSKDGGVQYPSHCLRKLTPLDNDNHRLSHEKWRDRILAIEERLASIEQRLSSLERLQNGQSKYLVMKQWTAGP